MNPQDLSRLGRHENPNHLPILVITQEGEKKFVFPTNTSPQRLETSSPYIYVKVKNIPHESAIGIALRNYIGNKKSTVPSQTAFGLVRRSDIEKLRSKGILVRVIGKTTTILQANNWQLDKAKEKDSFTHIPKTSKPSWKLNHAVSITHKAPKHAKSAYSDLYIIEYIQAEQAGIAKDEQALAERKKRLAKLVKAHQSSISNSSPSEKATQPSCRFHRSVNEKDLAVSLKTIYEKYFKKPTSMKLLSNFDSVSDFTAMLYIILVGCGVVANKQATPFCEFINMQVWKLEATDRTMRNHLNQLLGGNTNAETFSIESIRNEKLKQDFQNLKRCFQRSHFYGGISELLDNKE